MREEERGREKETEREGVCVGVAGSGRMNRAGLHDEKSLSSIPI